MTLSEGDLRLTLPERVAGRQFDDGPQHGLSHCMRAVDWILEFPEYVWFIEVKDPDAPGAKAHRNRNDFLQEFVSGKLRATWQPSFVTRFSTSGPVIGSTNR